MSVHQIFNQELRCTPLHFVAERGGTRFFSDSRAGGCETYSSFITTTERRFYEYLATAGSHPA